MRSGRCTKCSRTDVVRYWSAYSTDPDEQDIYLCVECGYRECYVKDPRALLADPLVHHERVGAPPGGPFR